MLLLTSTLLSQFVEIKTIMSTKVGGVSPLPYYLNMSYKVNDSPENVRKNRLLFLNSIGIAVEYLAIPQQIHSDNVSVITNPGKYQDCDSLLTQTRNLFLTITIADCVPIFLYDNANKIIGLVHSGWKGTMKKIVSNTLNIMINKLNSKAENIYSFIGPSASKCCYEINSETAKYFDSEVLIKKNERKYFLDLKKSNYNQLKNFDIPDKNIEISNYCTICNSDIFHSYRRDGKESGRMMALIGFRD